MNREACERLYEACYMRVFSYAMTLARDRHLAEEITQETFFRAFSRLDSFRGESDEATWLCAIARNLFNDEKRRQGKFGQLPDSLDVARLTAGDSSFIKEYVPEEILNLYKER